MILEPVGTNTDGWLSTWCITPNYVYRRYALGGGDDSCRLKVYNFNLGLLDTFDTASETSGDMRVFSESEIMISAHWTVGLNTLRKYSYSSGSLSYVNYVDSIYASATCIAKLGGYYLCVDSSGSYLTSFNSSLTLKNTVDLSIYSSGNRVRSICCIANRVFVGNGADIQSISIDGSGNLIEEAVISPFRYAGAMNLYNLNGCLLAVEMISDGVNGIYLYTYDESTETFFLKDTIVEEAVYNPNTPTDWNTANKVYDIIPIMTLTFFGAGLTGCLFLTTDGSTLYKNIWTSNTGYFVLEPSNNHVYMNNTMYAMNRTTENVSVITAPGI